MKSRVGIVLLLVSCLVGWYLWSHAGPDSVGSEVASPMAGQAGGRENTPEFTRQPAAAARQVPKRMTDVIFDEIARKGLSSPEVDDLVNSANVACSVYPERVREQAVVSEWAGSYLTKACEGFDASRLPKSGAGHSGPDYLRISIKGSQKDASEAALDYLRHPENEMGMVMAGVQLIGSGMLPEQDSYRLDAARLENAFQVAAVSLMCPGREGCAGARFRAAFVCTTVACPPDITYEAAMRSTLTPTELQASDRLRAWMLSIRR